MTGHEIEVYRDTVSGNVVVNATEVSAQEIEHIVSGGGVWDQIGDFDRRLTDAIGRWSTEVQGGARRRQSNLFERDRFVPPENPYAKIRTARRAMKDDRVGSAADVTEAMALSAVSIQTTEPDEQDIWNQWAAAVDLDTVMRQAWRNQYTDAQYICCMLWGHQTFQVRGYATDTGQARRRTYNLYAPTAIDFIDSLKVVPVSTLMFKRELLAYIATAEESASFDAILNGRPDPNFGGSGPGYYAMPTRSYGRGGNGGPDLDEPLGMPLEDDIVKALIMRRYVVGSVSEQIALSELGIDTTNLWLLDPRYTFRHTLTKNGSDRFAQPRLEHVFPLLDMKTQLQAMDRAHLIGGSNYIILITKGSEKEPASQKEIDALRGSVRSMGPIPVIVSDYRLKIEIISPDLTSVLDSDKYNTLNTAIDAAVFGTFVASGADEQDPLKQGRVIGRNLESRRLMMRRNLEWYLLDAVRRNNTASFTDRAKILFHPASISLVFDSAWASFLLDLREAREISRSTTLAQFDLDEADEAQLMEIEALIYDQTFGTIVPHGHNPDLAALPDPGQFQDPADPDGNADSGAEAAPAPGEGLDDPAPPQQPSAPSQPGPRLPGAPIPTRRTRPFVAPPTLPQVRPGQPAGQRAAGRSAGRRGGAAPGTGQGQPAVKRRGRAQRNLEAATAALSQMSKRKLVDIAEPLRIVGRHRMEPPALVALIAEHPDFHLEGITNGAD